MAYAAVLPPQTTAAMTGPPTPTRWRTLLYRNMKVLISASLVVLSVFLAPRHAAGAAAPRSETAYIQKVADGEARPAAVAEKRGKQGWWARSWTRTDGAGFFGKPTRTKTVENPDSTITLRYTRYSTEYDESCDAPRATPNSPNWAAGRIRTEPSKRTSNSVLRNHKKTTWIALRCVTRCSQVQSPRSTTMTTFPFACPSST